MAVNPSPWGPKPQMELADGTPAVGNKLFFYVAGSVNTKQNTYTDSTGGSANTNPLVLNSLGMPTTEIWWTAGQSYKVVYAPSTDTDPPTSPIFTVDNLYGQNDVSVSQSEWVTGPAPTYVGTTSFTLAGDQTSTFTPGLRLKFTVTAGTVYGTIYTSVFGALTTVTMAMDSTGNLDSGLSAVSYALLNSVTPSIPSVAQQTVASATTTNLASARGGTLHVSGTTTITGFGNAPSGMVRTVIFDGILTLTHNATSLILPGGTNIATAAGDVAIMVSEGSGNWRCVAYAGKSVRGTNASFSGTLDVTGLITATAAGISVPASALGSVYSGTYTPTLLSVTNVAGTTARLLSYARLGNLVFGGGQLAVDPTATGFTEIGVSLPVSSNFTTVYQAGGSGSTDTSGNNPVYISADTTNDRLALRFTATTAAGQDLSFYFVYIVA